MQINFDPLTSYALRIDLKQAAKQICILPERHGAIDCPTDLDRRINREILERHLRPGDTILAEDPLVNLPDFNLEEKITVACWDDPDFVAGIKKINQMMDAFYGLCLLFEGVHEDEPLRLQEAQRETYSSFKKTITLLAEELSLDPVVKEKMPVEGLSVGEFTERCKEIDELLVNHFNDYVLGAQVARGDSLIHLLDKCQGNIWVLGGKRHFIFSKKLKDHPQHTKAIENLHSALRASQASVMICKPLSKKLLPDANV